MKVFFNPAYTNELSGIEKYFKLPSSAERIKVLLKAIKTEESILLTVRKKIQMAMA